MDLWLRLADALARRARAPALPVLARALALAPGASLLDVGGGTGHVSEALGARAVVLEPDARRRAHGARARPGLAFAGGRAEALPFRGGSVDRVLFVLSLHHVEDPGQALGEARRVLRPGGLVVVHELDPSRRPGRWVAAFERWHGHAARFLEPSELAGALRAAGFEGLEQAPAGRGYVLAARRP